MKISTPEKITEHLHNALSKVGSFQSCAFLDYPAHPNIGDNLIWLGSILYLTNVMGTKIKYATSKSNFSATTLEEKAGNSPIILHGGGNLGDLWPEYQNFREYIISTYCDRPIVILPQSIYFSNSANLKKAADIFNRHPDLTIFVRDNRSYTIAIDAFDRCKVFKAPDMAFQMTGLPKIPDVNKSKSSILYHCRQDKEINEQFLANILEIPNLLVEDWVSYKWKFGHPDKRLSRYGSQLFRELWQKGLANPSEWISRQKWQYLHPYSPVFKQIDRPSIHQYSWSLMHSGIYQLQQHKLVITNRLHGHILCTLLQIPHIFLPNSYYKNESFYEEWTKEIPFCKFVKDTSKIKSVVQKFLADS
ncbi:polysaccharide pyruvyl transferase family protein [Nostoc sp. TCL26-01]|uniref:polysaccharide pyruvyl transferase family protein n=1 Tax=Nostoc sp. TCL26-01 TaxID=2576904 RepID=UPI0015BD1618|nr:polysaccharide pyruvyl transferase family protein [Nostoc sp. TCL26-01]QLE57611.1 polysaccharide polymerase [Nostoc sp. TCL26-01]